LCCVGWLNDPDVLLAVMLLKLLVVFVEFTEFIRKNISIRYEVKVLFTISFLHSNNVEAKSIFSGDFVTLWEMIDLLVFVESFVKVALAA
jgi:hypothetical protein